MAKPVTFRITFVGAFTSCSSASAAANLKLIVDVRRSVINKVA